MLDVIVVGCGASGVAALRRLHESGLSAVGLEAAHRVGGRVCTVPFGEGVVDIGAAWCHGEKDNVVFEMANPLGLLGRPEQNNTWFVQSNGELVPNEIGDSIVQALNEEISKADKQTDKSISECLQHAANNNETILKYPQLTSSFVEWFERNNHVGGQNDPRKGKSLRGMAEFWNCEGEFMLNWTGMGYQSILDILLNKFPDPSKEIPVQIFLNKEVERIQWGPSNAIGQGNPLVQVTCTDGSMYSAKSVIVTVSVGVLKERHTQLFSPPLPEAKINAIQTQQMAILDKIYIEFVTPWWPKTPANFTFLWRDEDKAKFSEDESWITEVYGLQTVEYQPNVLLAWIYGNGAEKMETVSLEGIRAGVEKILDVFRKRFNVTKVKNLLRSQWASKPLARGAYAHRSVLTEQNGGGAAILSEPIYSYSDGSTAQFPVVCFGGEATSLRRHSAVHGAIEAGFREADRLIDAFKG